MIQNFQFVRNVLRRGRPLVVDLAEIAAESLAKVVKAVVQVVKTLKANQILDRVSVRMLVVREKLPNDES